MKITDPEIIKNGEKDLIDAVKEDIDLEAVRDILEKRLAASNLTANGGEIIVHNNQIAFRLDFSVRLSGSLMFDRQGNYIPDAETESEDPSEETATETLDIDDIDIESALDEIGPESGSMTEDTTDEFENDDDLDIGLPDYSGDDDDALDTDLSDDMDLPDEELHDETGLSPESEDLFEDDADDLLSRDLDPDTDLDLLNDMAPEDEDLLEDEQEFDGAAEPDEAALSQDEEIEPGKSDDDINDILKESREFWEQKKDS